MKMIRQVVAVLFVLSFGCGKKVFLDGNPKDTVKLTDDSKKTDPDTTGGNKNSDGHGDELNLDHSCAADQTYYKRFDQPDAVVNTSVDILFVLDSSTSLDAHRNRLASEIDAFTSGLDPGTDFRMAVLLGHGGGQGSLAGELLSINTRDPKVLSSTDLSVAEIRRAMLRKFSTRIADVDEANGEALLYSLGKLLDHLPAVQAQGFLRPNAAWSFVFVTDENDICYPPELHGYSQFPDYVASNRGTEAIAYRNYCVDGAGNNLFSPERIYQKLISLHPSQRIALGGLIHDVAGDVPAAQTGGEEAVSHGTLELLQLHNRSTLMSLGSPSYRPGLLQIATQSSSSVNLQTEFPLDQGVELREDSIRVHVDGKGVDATYDGTATAVHLTEQNAGVARSVIEVNACKK